MPTALDETARTSLKRPARIINIVERLKSDHAPENLAILVEAAKTNGIT